MDNNIDPNNAAKKPDTMNPETIVETNQNKRALMIIVNNPKVSKLIGTVKSINRGFIKIFTSPITNAVHKAGIKPARLIPGTIQATKINDNAKNIHFTIILNIYYSFFDSLNIQY
jgi:hypothetical protein